MNGFSFCGVHCSKYGVGFIPSAAKRTLSTAEFKPIESTVTGRHGGYHFGNQVEIREFVLECYFESITIDTYEQILQWLHRDREGKLIFDDRPFVYYDARVAKVIEGKTYTTNHEHKYGTETLYSGTITITLKADDPFGKMIYKDYGERDIDNAMVRCGIISKDEMPSAIEPASGDYLIYNPGTEISETVIRVAGTAPNGVKITNRTTGDVCELLALPSEPDYVELDSDSGSVMKLPTNPDTFAFEYHDCGYIRLAPCIPYERDVAVSYVEGSNKIDFTLLDLTEHNVGQYVRLNGEWIRIIAVSGRNATISKRMNVTGAEYTMLATMNEITVEADGAELTMLEIDYIPKVR